MSKSFLSKVRKNQSQFFFYAALVLFAVSLVILGAAIYVEHHNHADSVGVQTPYRVGQIISMGQASLQLTNITYSNGQTAFRAPADKHYLILSLHTQNRSDQPIGIFPASDTYVKTADGTIIYLTPYGLNQPFRAGELLPGDNEQGQLSFLVPKTGQLKFYVDAIWSGGILPFAIN